jgi:hypothetical protein
MARTLRLEWLPDACYAFRADLMDCHDVEETTRRLLKDIEHHTKPERCPYNGHQAMALQQAAERVLAPTAKDDDLLWLVLLTRTVEQFAEERSMWWPVGGERSNRAEDARVLEANKRRLDEEERKRTEERLAERLAEGKEQLAQFLERRRAAHRP